MSCNETALHGARYGVEEGNVLRARVVAESGRWAGPGSGEALGRPSWEGARSLAQLQQRRKQLVFKRGQRAERRRRDNSDFGRRELFQQSLKDRKIAHNLR